MKIYANVFLLIATMTPVLKGADSDGSCSYTFHVSGREQCQGTMGPVLEAQVAALTQQIRALDTQVAALTQCFVQFVRGERGKKWQKEGVNG